MVRIAMPSVSKNLQSYKYMVFELYNGCLTFVPSKHGRLKKDKLPTMKRKKRATDHH